MQRIAIIDIGSNSARLVISHIHKNGSYLMMYNQKETLRLSQKVNSDNLLTEEAFSSTLDTMKSFMQMCKLYKVDKIIAVATAAIRNASNGKELIELIAAETGINLHIISGAAEAYISFLGVVNTLEVKDGIIFDLGGGSTELILFHDRKIQERVSIPFGAVNTTHMFNTRNELTPQAYIELSFFLNSQLEKYPWLKESELPLIGVGGTIRTIAKIIQREKNYPSTRLHNYRFPVQEFRNLFERLRNTTLEERKKISGLSSERRDIILAGCSIINCLLHTTGASQLITSGCGLREGLFYDYYSKANNIPIVSEDILKDSRENMMKLYGVDQKHARQVSRLALSIFKGWQRLHHLPKETLRILETAALLHDTGIEINFYSHARHSAYIIQNAKLFGLSHKELLMTSVVAGWHHGPSKNYFKDQFYQEMLEDTDWEQLQKLSLILSLAEALDYTQTGQVHKLEACLLRKQPLLRIFCQEAPGIELHELKSRLSWFKKIFATTLELEIVTSKSEV